MTTSVHLFGEKVHRPTSVFPSYLRRYWNKLQRSEYALSKHETKLVHDRAKNAQMKYELTILSKIAEPTTDSNRAAKANALLQVAEMVENLDFFGIYPRELRKYLGLPSSRIKQILRSGELETFDHEGISLVRADSVTDLLRKWANELKVQAPLGEGR